MKPRPILVGHTLDESTPLSLTPDQRACGVHVVGAPGSGKSKLLEMMIRADLRRGAGGMLIDPHGELFRAVLRFCARHRFHRRIYILNPSDGQRVCPFNPFAPRPGGDVSTRVRRCVTAVLKAWGVQNPDETPRLLRWLKNTFALAMERGDVSIAELPLLFDSDPKNAAVRAYLAANTSVESEWRMLNRLKRVSEFDEQTQSTRNRLDVLTTARTTRRFLSVLDPRITLDLGRAIEEGAFILVNLQPSPNLDPHNARLLGTLLVSELFDAIRQRRLRCGRPPRPFCVYIDEAQNFITHDVPELFAQGRKFGLNLTVAHQFLDQMRHEDERILAALNAACRTKVAFAIGSDTDAKDLVHELFPGQINYTEVKHTHQQTKFRPVATRDTTTSRSRGGGTGHSQGRSRGTTRTLSNSTGRSHSHSKGHETGHSAGDGRSRSTGSSTGATRSVGATRTVGRSTTRGTADGVAEGHTTSQSLTRGAAKSITHSQNRGNTRGTSATTTHSTTTQEGPDGIVTHTEATSHTTSETSSDVEGFSKSLTSSKSITEGESDSTVRSHVDTYAEGDSEAEAETWSEGQSETHSETDSESHTTADSEGCSESDTDAESESASESTGRSHGEDESDSHSESWSETIGDGPVTRHEEFSEDTAEFYTLEDQRQRLADMLRVQPQSVCVVRTPDGRARQIRVDFVPAVLLSDKRVADYEAEMAAKTGALLPAQVDAEIERRHLFIEQHAREFATAQPAPFDDLEGEPVHLPETQYGYSNTDPISVTPKICGPFSRPGRKPRSK